MSGALGVVRKFDKLGRLVIPMEVRRVNGWEEGQPMEMFSTEDGVMIRAYEPNKGQAKEEMLELIRCLGFKLEDSHSKESLEKLQAFIKEVK